MCLGRPGGQRWLRCPRVAGFSVSALVWSNIFRTIAFGIKLKIN